MVSKIIAGCIATNLCTCICKVVEHSPGGPFPHRNSLLHRSNLQSLVQFHRQCHVQLPGLLPQNILLDRVPPRCRARTAAVQAFDSAPCISSLISSRTASISRRATVRRPSNTVIPWAAVVA